MARLMQASMAIPDLAECQWAGGMRMTAGVVPEALVKVGERQVHKTSTQTALSFGCFPILFRFSTSLDALSANLANRFTH